MDRRLPPLVGLGACLVVAAAALLPLVALSPTARAGLGVYYGTGPVGPVGAGILAGVAAIAFASGYAGRTDPATVAGATLVLGLGVLGAVAAWAPSADPGLVPAGPDWLGPHRWVLLAAAAAVPASAAAYARAAGVV